eukprot:6194335-Pleurochrysis_carterae.AAC.1
MRTHLHARAHTRPSARRARPCESVRACATCAFGVGLRLLREGEAAACPLSLQLRGVPSLAQRARSSHPRPCAPARSLRCSFSQALAKVSVVLFAVGAHHCLTAPDRHAPQSECRLQRNTVKGCGQEWERNGQRSR